MRIEDIQEHLDKYNDYDIRQNKNCRFVDQKCTPDVVCFIADCILSTDCATKAFTVSDLWKTQFFIENTRIVFHKPPLVQGLNRQIRRMCEYFGYVPLDLSL